MASLAGDFSTAEAGYMEQPLPRVAEWFRADWDRQVSVRRAGWIRAADALLPSRHTSGWTGAH
jgi:hypothetical protein